MNIIDLKRVVGYGLQGIKENPASFLDFKTVYRQAFYRDACINCPEGLDSSFHFAAEKLRIEERARKPVIDKDAKYILKTDMVVFSTTLNEDISNINLTEDKAKVFLSEDVKHAKLFEKLSSDWETQKPIEVEKPKAKGKGK